jgi:hypothetical protein
LYHALRKHPKAEPLSRLAEHIKAAVRTLVQAGKTDEQRWSSETFTRDGQNPDKLAILPEI